MHRLSEIINEVYLKYLPLMEKVGATFNLDFPDSTIKIESGERVKKDLEKSVKSAVERSSGSSITISVKKGKIIVSDSGTILSKTACSLLSSEHVLVKSRVGFGTTVTISF